MKKILSSVKRCSCCGANIFTQGYKKKSDIVQLMTQQQICYDCAYWLLLVQNPPENLEVIDGICYTIYPCDTDDDDDSDDRNVILGGGGDMHYFFRPNRSIFKSKDIWLIGKVPDRFIDKFPDTASEMQCRAYKKFFRDKRICYARSCYDRYHCLRYERSIEDAKGAFNEVPSTWKPGGERCHAFVSMIKPIYKSKQNLRTT